MYDDKVKVFGDIYFYPPKSTAERPIETLYGHLPKAEQYWRRQTDFLVNKSYPNLFFDYDPHLPINKRIRINAIKTHYSGDRLVSISVEDTQALIKLVDREVRRMTYGIYVMINGNKTYFPGYFYGAMQWCKFLGNKLNHGYAEYRRYQREYACQRQKCIEDPKISGYYYQKIKKCGASAMLACFYAIESITNRQFIAASMSKTHDTAKGANFKYYLHAMKNLPAILLPSIEYKRWASAPQKIEIRTNDAELSLENTVVAAPTTEDGLDGLPPLKRVNLDEIAKMRDAELILVKTREQLKVNAEKQGIIEMTCYPPENDTASFKYCKNMYLKDCKDVDEEGYPKNGIIPLYVGLLDATKGTHNIYGEPDRVKAQQIEHIERAKCDTPAKLQARKRQYHLNVKESWESGGGGSVYDNIALAEQKATLEEQYNQGQRNYIEGNLEWTAGRMSSVRFVPLTHEEIMAGKTAKWKIYCTLEYLEKNTNLCFKMPRRKMNIKGDIVELLQPPDDVIHCGGCDPVDYAYIAEMGKKQSTNASVIKDLQGNLMSVYWYRPEDPDEAIEDFCMEMIFWGLRGIVEGNRKTTVTALEKLGMYYFMLVRHPNGEILPYKHGIAIKHISSGKDLKSTYITLTVKAIKHNVRQLKNLDIVNQHMDFDPEDTQEYDLSVGDSLCNVAVDAMQTWVITKKSHQDKYDHLGAAIQGLA